MSQVNWCEFFAYAPETGILTWKVTRGPNAAAGQEAGSTKHDGRYRSLVTRSGNQRNRRVATNSPLGVPGVLPRKRGFEVRCAGQYVGHFRDFYAAVAARKAAEKKHGYHPNHGRKTR